MTDASLLVGWMGLFHEGKEDLQRKIGMAMQALMLAGYDSCPIIGFDYDAVAKLINLPANHVIGRPMVAIGKKVKDSWPRPGQQPLAELVIENKW